ncbi:hypothetical protein VTN31DRAFT_4834 [Thermomyces dupontii]|uniref:uncharacterized protein n=1 Tax=Talaromyces thermophilus TaxID=28565 RepID=UPI003743F888
MRFPRRHLATWATVVVVFWSWIGLVNAHTVIVYPGWRGNNLHSNGTVEETNGLGQMATNGSYVYPYGMQWVYPCGGMPTSRNRTKWPVQGGAIAVQPGWFPGHESAFFYFNLGLGEQPPNMSHPMLPPFGIYGPTNGPYPGTFCLPQVPLPPNISVKVGDYATIQVIETAQHGASLYNCVDIEFAEPQDCPEVTEENCFNSSNIRFGNVYMTELSTNLSIAPSVRTGMLAWISSLLTAMMLFLASIW